MTSDDKTDAALVQDVLAGEKDAFSTLVRRYQNYAFGVALGVLADFDLARDVVQEAFLRSYHDLAKLREPERFGGWLGGIVRHTALRAVRELERVKALADELSQHLAVADPVRSPACLVEEAEQKLMMHEALRRLPPSNREAVCLHYLSGWSYADIARSLGVTEATVLGRLQRGRAQLKKELAMIEETFQREGLPRDFSTEVKRLLDAAEHSARERQQAIRRLAEIGEPAVDSLLQALPDARASIRRVAASALCRIGDARALGPILRLLYTQDGLLLSDVYLSGQVLKIPGVKAELLTILRERKPVDQWCLLQALSHVAQDAEVHVELLRLFRDPQSDWGARLHALQAVCFACPDEAQELVVEALHEPEVRQRSGWAWYIAVRLGLKVPLEICRRGLAREVAALGRHNAAALMLRHGDEGRRTLEQLLQTGSSAERAAVALALAQQQHPAAFEPLIEELASGYREKKWVRRVAGVLAANFPERLAIWARANEQQVASCPPLAWALARVRLDAGAPTADDLCRVGPPSVRAANLRRRARDSGQATLPGLRACLRENKPHKVAQEAFRQMLRLGDAALPVAVEMLESDHWTERKAAVCLLRRWGKLTSDQKARALADTHIAVCHAAEWHPSPRAVETRSTM